jgi:hypothetical protein
MVIDKSPLSTTRREAIPKSKEDAKVGKLFQQFAISLARTGKL